ncbi:MAG: serine/threonine protein kinase [Cyanobacterium sp. T60_A2020_053]|nr:serine/threonine protein kinase [Cyanobacterium sp. T60_A2020_053]
MKILCTRPYCNHPTNHSQELNNQSLLKTVQQKYCISCGMPLILAGRYLPIQLLGKGGFGAAYLAIDRYSPTLRKCVVKQFQPEGQLREAELKLAQELFEREAFVLEQLGNKHPQIPDLFAYFPLLVNQNNSHQNNVKESYFYLVQEFIDGEDLEQELLRKGAFSEEEVTVILQEILKILIFVHDNNSIHRDIKPSNIMRTKEGILYLLDFGAVKLVTSNANPAQKSTGIYSMGFAPPEQMTGAEVFPSTDLYALAVTCVNLLTGKPITELYDPYTNTWKWREYAPVGDRLWLTLEKMLQHNPTKRFTSAQEALRIIDPESRNKPINSNPISSPSPSSLSPSPSSLSTSSSPASPISPASPASPASPISPSEIPPLPLAHILRGAGFVGFEGSLLIIALNSALPFLSFPLVIGIWGGITGLIIYLLYKKFLEKWDLLIFGLVTVALVYFFPFLHSYLLINYQFNQITIIIIPLIIALGITAVTSVGLIIFQLLRCFLK